MSLRCLPSWNPAGGTAGTGTDSPLSCMTFFISNDIPLGAMVLEAGSLAITSKL